MGALFDTQSTEKQLDSFIAEKRLAALKALVSEDEQKPASSSDTRNAEMINMHFHSFFSYNSNGYSPSRIAWESRKAGLYAAALCDFDVLDGLEEFLKAGFITELRTAVHLETRAFFKEYAELNINSPGEPGVTYIMGAGFARIPKTGTPEASTLAEFRRQANDRNKALVKRVNSKLGLVNVDYEKEVVPMSPGGCPTERHIIRAYRLKAEEVFGVTQGLFDFWAELMKTGSEDINKIYRNTPTIEDKIRSLLAKAGGLGYERPTEQSFPTVADFIQWTLNCGAIPTIAWLDGTSQGEENPREMFQAMINKGVCALNIIPDRNHNIADTEQRAKKLHKLDEVISLALSLEMPINIGTEMNKDGQPFADDSTTGALRPYHKTFLRGARIMVGQTILSRFADFSYVGPNAQSEFGDKIKEKNDFFEAVGCLPPVNHDTAKKLQDAGSEKAFKMINESISGI